MKQLHWSRYLLTFVTIEITYTDDARQGWDYDCSKFATLEDMRLNMTADFTDTSGFAANPHIVRTDWDHVMLHVSLNSETYSIDLGAVTYTNSTDFVNLIFENIGAALEWQPAVTS